MAKDKSKKKDADVEETKGKKSKAKAGKESSKAAAPADDEDDLDPKGGGDGFSVKDNVGSLVLVTPTGIKRDFKTSSGIAEEVIVADVVVLEEGEKPKNFEVFADSLIFQKALISSLKEKLRTNSALAAKIVMGEAAAGKNAPYLFERSDDAKKLAKAWLATQGPNLD